MAFHFNSRQTGMTEINMVPLIDVMLVLLVIFMITAPLMNHAVKINLPETASQPMKPLPSIDLAIDADGRYFWNDQAMALADLEQVMHTTAQLPHEPEVHIRAERTVPYEAVAQAMAAASRQGLDKIAFVSLPAQSSQ